MANFRFHHTWRCLTGHFDIVNLGFVRDIHTLCRVRAEVTGKHDGSTRNVGVHTHDYRRQGWEDSPIHSCGITSSNYFRGLTKSVFLRLKVFRKCCCANQNLIVASVTIHP